MLIICENRKLANWGKKMAEQKPLNMLSIVSNKVSVLSQNNDKSSSSQQGNEDGVFSQIYDEAIAAIKNPIAAVAKQISPETAKQDLSEGIPSNPLMAVLNNLLDIVPSETGEGVGSFNQQIRNQQNATLQNILAEQNPVNAPIINISAAKNNSQLKNIEVIDDLALDAVALSQELSDNAVGVAQVSQVVEVIPSESLSDGLNIAENINVNEISPDNAAALATNAENAMAKLVSANASQNQMLNESKQSANFQIQNDAVVVNNIFTSIAVDNDRNLEQALIDAGIDVSVIDSPEDFFKPEIMNQISEALKKAGLADDKIADVNQQIVNKLKEFRITQVTENQKSSDFFKLAEGEVSDKPIENLEKGFELQNTSASPNGLVFDPENATIDGDAADLSLAKSDADSATNNLANISKTDEAKIAQQIKHLDGHVKANPYASHMPPNEQITVKIQNAIEGGQDKISIQLQPAELGRIDVSINLNGDGKAQLTVTADNRATLDMLQRTSKDLERSLMDAGIKTDMGSLSFNLRGDNANQQWAENSENYKFANYGEIDEENMSDSAKNGTKNAYYISNKALDLVI